MEKNFYYGCHLSNSKGVINTINTMLKMGGNFIQIFVSNPQSGKTGANTIKSYSENSSIIKDYAKTNNVKIVIHGPYVLNFAKQPNFETINWQLNSLWNELLIAEYIGAIGVVIHVGKYLELTIDDGIKNMVDSFKYIIKKLQDNKMKTCLILETAAGQGTELLVSTDNNILDFINFYHLFTDKEKKNFKLCIDTCHIFTAGYDIRKKEQVKQLFKQFKQLVGLENIALIHLNDCKSQYGTRVDRHENLGQGNIGWNGIKQVIKQCYKYDIPIILETPTEDDNEIKFIGDYIKKIK